MAGQVVCVESAGGPDITRATTKRTDQRPRLHRRCLAFAHPSPIELVYDKRIPVIYRLSHV